MVGKLPTPYWVSQDEQHVLYHGDCLTILPMLNTVDVIITDPPYGDAATHAQHLSGIKLRNGEPAGRALGFAGISKEECVNLVRAWVQIARRWVVFTCEWKYAHALDEIGLLVRLGIWHKPDGAPQFSGDRPGMGWESIAICHRHGQKRWNGGGKHAFWTFPKGENLSGHPTGKPLGLFVEFVVNFSDYHETVLDPYAGSGTTGVACIRRGRRFIGIEVEERYCEIAARRMDDELKSPTLPFLLAKSQPVQAHLL